MVHQKSMALPVLAWLVLFQPALAFAQQAQQAPGSGPPSWDCAGPWHMWHGGWGFWWMFPVMMLFMIVLGVGVFLLVRSSRGGAMLRWGSPWHMMTRHGHSWGDPTYSALQVLNERFARGEIQRQEYDEKKAAILSSGPP